MTLKLWANNNAEGESINDAKTISQYIMVCMVH